MTVTTVRFEDGSTRTVLGSGVVVYRNPAGQVHRDGGPAIAYPDGGLAWCWQGRWHRDNGPAIVRADGTRIWFRDGQLHRDGGPAVVRADGAQQWWVNGVRVSPPTG